MSYDYYTSTNTQTKFIYAISIILVININIAGLLFFLSLNDQPSLFHSSDVNRVSEQRVRVSEELVVDAKNARREIAEDYVVAVVNDISPQISPIGQILTKQQIDDLVAQAIEKYSTTKKNDGNPKWTFEIPCKIKINKSLYGMGGELKFGDINICKSTIIAGIFAAIVSCRTSIDFKACLISSVLATDDIKKEIDKPVEFQYINYR